MKPLVVALLLTVSLGTFAQDREKERPRHKQSWMNKDGKYDHNFMSTFGVGVGFQNFDGLNDRMANYSQYEALKDYTAVLSLGWLKEKNQLVSLSNFTAGSSLSGDRDKKSSVIRFLGVGADLGFDVVKNDRIMLFPLVGIGYEWYQAKFYKDNSGVSFNDVVQSPATQNAVRALDLKNSFFTYRAGVGFNIKSQRNSNYGIGLLAAYTGSFQEKAWKSNENQSLLNSPEDRLGRIQISVIFTGSPMGRHMK